MINTLVEADKEYELIKHKLNEFKFIPNVANILAIYGKFNDLYTISLMAFNDNVNWIPGNSINSDSA
jgi:hypothetical protein